MAEYLLLTLMLYLSSIIFIVAAFLLQKLSEMNNWESGFLATTKNVFTFISVISIIASVPVYLIFKPF